jgi:hypothetical protein
LRLKHEGPKSNAPQQRPQPASKPQAKPSQAGDLAGRRYQTGASLQQPGASAQLPTKTAHPEVKGALHGAASQLAGGLAESIVQGAARTGIPAAAAAAVVLAEGHLASATQGDRMLLRFEPYAFFQATGRWLVATHKDQAAEYRSFEQARAIDPNAALHSVRMGLAQVSGGEAQVAGFVDAQAMWSQLQAGPEAQVDALFGLVAGHDGLREALQAEDWQAVAELRAGPGYGALGYDDALAAGAAAWRDVFQPGGDDDDDKPKKKPKR